MSSPQMPASSARRARRVEFDGALGNKNVGYLELPADELGMPRAWAVFAHCFTCSKDLRSARRLTAALAQQGFGVLRFDFTGLGESEGDFSDTNFSSEIEDVVLAADWLRREHRGPSLLVGHSLGGAAVLAAASRIPEATAVATIGAPSDPAHLVEGVLADVDRSHELSEVRIAGRPFRVRRQLFEDLEQHRLLETVAGLRRALLVMHSPVDNVVGVDHARQIFEAAKHPKSFVALDGADHLLLEREADALFAAQVLGCWASRYVAQVEQEEQGPSGIEASPAEVEPAVEGIVEVHGGAEGLTQHIRARQHRLRADEPASVGGSDLGPTPYELLLAALGSCISMTLRLYADRKGLPLESVRVRLRHSRIHARDCEECETESGHIDRIEKRLELYGPELTEEQHARLLEISQRCPVHRTLTSETRIESVDELGLGQTEGALP